MGRTKREELCCRTWPCRAVRWGMGDSIGGGGRGEGCTQLACESKARCLRPRRHLVRAATAMSSPRSSLSCPHPATAHCVSSSPHRSSPSPTSTLDLLAFSTCGHWSDSSRLLSVFIDWDQHDRRCHECNHCTPSPTHHGISWNERDRNTASSIGSHLLDCGRVERWEVVAENVGRWFSIGACFLSVDGADTEGCVGRSSYYAGVNSVFY